jgi:predicted chitinase
MPGMSSSKADYAKYLNKAMKEAGITTKAQKAAFIAQVNFFYFKKKKNLKKKIKKKLKKKFKKKKVST